MLNDEIWKWLFPCYLSFLNLVLISHPIINSVAATNIFSAENCYIFLGVTSICDHRVNLICCTRWRFPRNVLHWFMSQFINRHELITSEHLWLWSAFTSPSETLCCVCLVHSPLVVNCFTAPWPRGTEAEGESVGRAKQPLAAAWWCAAARQR